MTKYNIQIVSRAQKDYKRLDKIVQQRVNEAILKLETNRTPQQFKPLIGRSIAHYRIRIGDYRVLYDVYDEEKTVLILRIGHRSNIYR